MASAGTLLVPSFLYKNAGFFNKSLKGKKLVIIQLSGGNDGLNTIVPFRNDLYYKYRPSIAMSKKELLTLNDQCGVSNHLQGLKYLYDEGFLSVVNQVGYPNPNRSHFRSLDIWHTASDANEYKSHGWIGNYLDSQCHECHPYEALEIDESLTLAMKGQYNHGVAVTDPQKLYKLASFDPETTNIEGNDNLNYLKKTYSSVQHSAEYLHETSKIYKSKKEYPQSRFGQQLKTIAELIISRAETSIYYTSLTGFDTHIKQEQRLSRLHQTYSEALKILVDDLKENGVFDDTLILTFSEFGRRVKENASGGTDHGTANNVFLVGGNLKQPGIYNDLPDLSTLDNDDLIHQVDFRRVYATLLDKWLQVDSNVVLGKTYKNLSFI